MADENRQQRIERYRAESQRADALAYALKKDEALAILRQSLSDAEAGGDQDYRIFFEAEILHLTQSDYPKQIAMLSEALDWAKNQGLPDDHFLHTNLGVCHSLNGEYKAAIECYDKALAENPRDWGAVRDRAVPLGLGGDKDKAVSELRRCLESNPTDELAMIWLVHFAGANEVPALVKSLEEHWKKREDEKSQAEREARERQLKLEAWRDLSARSAHVFGNQLFTMEGSLRSLQNLSDPKAQEAVADLKESVAMMNLTNDQYRRFRTNEQPTLAPTQIGPLIQNLARRNANIAPNVIVSCEVSEDLPVCNIERKQIEQALSELLENAVHHLPDGGTILFKATRAPYGTKPKVLITVEDSGPGVPPELKRRIFEPFFSERAGGTGLGLAIVHQTVENHGGSIRETGQFGKGAKFEIELPAQVEQEATK